MKGKINIKLHIDDDVLDLSLMNLEDVPVKEIASYPKITILDLSSNHLKYLSVNFAPSLSHLTKLDLAQNELTSLPDNFGLLTNLKHLDLFKNQLTSLPLSFCQLKSLKWLDVKCNPLTEKLKSVIGTCTNSAECALAARRIVNFMTDIVARVELEKKRRAELIKIEQESAAIDTFKPKEKASKKKKKIKANLENNNVRPVDDVKEGFRESKTTGFKVSTKPSNSKLWTLVKNLIKTFMYCLLFIGMTMFVISLIDEPTYHVLKVRVNGVTHAISSNLPVEFVNASKKGITIASHLVKYIVDTTSYLVKQSLTSAAEYYQWFTTDETVKQCFVSLRELTHAIFIKFVDVASAAYTRTASFFSSVMDSATH